MSISTAKWLVPLVTVAVGGCAFTPVGSDPSGAGDAAVWSKDGGGVPDASPNNGGDGAEASMDGGGSCTTILDTRCNESQISVCGQNGDAGLAWSNEVKCPEGTVCNGETCSLSGNRGDAPALSFNVNVGRVTGVVRLGGKPVLASPYCQPGGSASAGWVIFVDKALSQMFGGEIQCRDGSYESYVPWGQYEVFVQGGYSNLPLIAKSPGGLVIGEESVVRDVDVEVTDLELALTTGSAPAAPSQFCPLGGAQIRLLWSGRWIADGVVPCDWQQSIHLTLGSGPYDVVLVGDGVNYPNGTWNVGSANVEGATQTIQFDVGGFADVSGTVVVQGLQCTSSMGTLTMTELSGRGEVELPIGCDGIFHAQLLPGRYAISLDGGDAKVSLSLGEDVEVRAPGQVLALEETLYPVSAVLTIDGQSVADIIGGCFPMYLEFQLVNSRRIAKLDVDCLSGLVTGVLPEGRYRVLAGTFNMATGTNGAVVSELVHGPVSPASIDVRLGELAGVVKVNGLPVSPSFWGYAGNLVLRDIYGGDVAKIQIGNDGTFSTTVPVGGYTALVYDGSSTSGLPEIASPVGSVLVDDNAAPSLTLSVPTVSLHGTVTVNGKAPEAFAGCDSRTSGSVLAQLADTDSARLSLACGRGDFELSATSGFYRFAVSGGVGSNLPRGGLWLMAPSVTVTVKE